MRDWGSTAGAWTSAVAAKRERDADERCALGESGRSWRAWCSGDARGGCTNGADDEHAADATVRTLMYIAVSDAQPERLDGLGG